MFSKKQDCLVLAGDGHEATVVYIRERWIFEVNVSVPIRIRSESIIFATQFMSGGLEC